MDFLLNALGEWLREILTEGIMSNLSGMFDSVNQQVADISAQVGQTPQGWNGSIFSMIQNLSNSVMVPVAGVILAIVMTVELIQMITDRNNMHDVDTWMIFKWVFKSAAAILLVTNTWNIVMGVFDLAQSVVTQASGVIGADASIDIYTKMRNVAGLSTSDAQKSSDMFAKCRYMDEITGSRGVIFATGTPVSNSMTELYTMQRYLQYDRLQELNMTHFDCWASRFGETVTALELAPEGTGYRARTRFSKFFNLPELMNLFREVADIKTADQLHLPTPEVEYHNIVAQPTEQQQEMVKALSQRASLVHSGTVDPSQDNMLKITSDGRKLGLDQRIINQALPDEPGTKVNQCVANIMQIWRDGEADKLTQMVFCDISTPQAAFSRKTAKALDRGCCPGRTVPFCPCGWRGQSLPRSVCVRRGSAYAGVWSAALPVQPAALSLPRTMSYTSLSRFACRSNTA